jgi:hypothetical protein
MVRGLAAVVRLFLHVITRTKIRDQMHDGIKGDEVGRDAARSSGMRKTYKT